MSMLPHLAIATAVSPAAKIRRMIPILVVYSSSALTSIAQEGAGGGSQEIVELAPFEVRAEMDNGYQANGALSGTRLRTDLRDIASSVSVATKELMRDINANDLEGLLVYTLGTEVDGLGGNFSNSVLDSSGFQNFDLVNRQPSSGSRVRGLTKADTTSNFFLTSIPPDNYNAERFEISRGANAMLFGLGSPAGIINTSIVNADTSRNKGEVRTQVGTYGTTRGSIDLNHVLLDDKLAFRFAAALTDQKYQQDAAFSRSKRFYETITYRPFRNTVLRARVENGKIDAVKPRVNPPFDSFSWWWDIGQPVYDPTTGVVTYLGTQPSDPNISPTTASGGKNGSILTTGYGSTWNLNPGVVFEDPNTSVPGITGTGANALKAVWERYRVSGTSLVNDGLTTLINSANYLNNLHKSDITTNFWRTQQITDPGIFDFYHQTIDGPDNTITTRWRTHNATLEQTLFGGRMGIELAYNREDMRWSFVNPIQHSNYTIYLDINSKLMNGQVNPNYLRPVSVDIGWVESNVSDREAARATAYYKLDLRRARGPEWLGKLLGQHTMTGTFVNQTHYTENYGGRQNLMGLDFVLSEQATNSSVSNTAQDGRRALARVNYLGPSVLNASGPQNTGIQGLAASHAVDDMASLAMLYYQAPPSGVVTPATPVTRNFSLLSNPPEDKRPLANYGANKSRVRVNSASLVAQSWWMEGSLVSTLGWRRDEYSSFNSGLPPYDPASGLRVLDPDIFYPKPDIKGAKNSFSWGMVGHLPPRYTSRLPLKANLSAFYNESDNFTPRAQRFDLYDKPIDPESGSTREYGIILSFLDNKFDLRVTNYETNALYATTAGLRSVINNIASLPQSLENNIAPGTNYDLGNPLNVAGIQAWNEFMAGPAGQTIVNTFRFKYQNPSAPQGQKGSVTSVDRRSDIVVGPTNLTSSGWEFELVFNPTRSWRLAFNAAKANAQQNNTGVEVRRFLEENFLPLINGPAGRISTTNSATGETLAARVQRQLLVPLYKIVLQDGSPNAELREWRWNVVTSYRFMEERLKGWRVGGDIRWQDRAAIGFPIKQDDTGLVNAPIYDVTNPYYGPTEVRFGMHLGYERKLQNGIVWSAQLNVKNIGKGNELIPVSAQPDGSIASWRISEPMTWTLSNTFSF